MEGQSVVLRAEKGKLRLMVDDEEGGPKQEMVYEVTAQEKKDPSLETIKREETDGKDREAEGGEARDGRQEGAEDHEAYGGGEMPGSVIGVDGEAQAGGSLPGTGGGVDVTEPVAGPGDGGNASGPAASDPGGKGSGIEPSSCGIVGTEEQGRGDERVGAPVGTPPVQASTQREESRQARGVAGGWSLEEGLTILMEIGDGAEATEAQEG